MDKNQAYLKLLNKILTIENVGEILYRALVSKTKDNNLILIYERLARNERETAKRIKEEISAVDKDNPILMSGAILSLTKIICGILTSTQLTLILRKALKKKVYRSWYNSYKDNNQDLWDLLLSHENLQRELLESLWNK